MILGNINDKTQYELLSKNPNYKLALDYIKNLTKDNPKTSPTVLNDEVYINFNCGNSALYDGTKYETHIKYIDIHYVIDGKEEIYIAPKDNMQVTKPYDETKDVAFGTCDKYTKYTLMPGDYIVVFPEEAHFPGCGDQSLLDKLIVKIKC